MDPNELMGRLLIGTGILLVLLGLVFYLDRWLPFFGRLPGDIRIEKPHFKFYFPVVTCLLLSAVLSGIFYLLSKFK